MRYTLFLILIIVISSCTLQNSVKTVEPEIITGEVPYSLRENAGKMLELLKHNYLNKYFIHFYGYTTIADINFNDIFILTAIKFSAVNNYPGNDFHYGYDKMKFVFIFENIQTGQEIITDGIYSSSSDPRITFLTTRNRTNVERSKIQFAPSGHIDSQGWYIGIGEVILPINSYQIFLETGTFFQGFYSMDTFEENINKWLESEQRETDRQRALLAYEGTQYIDFTYSNAFGNANIFHNIALGTILFIDERSIGKIYSGVRDNLFIFEWEIRGYSYEPTTIIQFLVEDDHGLIRFNGSRISSTANEPNRVINTYQVNGPIIIKRTGTMNLTLNNGRIVPRPLFEMLECTSIDIT